MAISGTGTIYTVPNVEMRASTWKPEQGLSKYGTMGNRREKAMKIFDFALTGRGEDEPEPEGPGWPLCIAMILMLLAAMMGGW